MYLESYGVWPFQSDFFNLAMYIEVSSISFHGSLAHYFLSPNSIPLYECTGVCVSTDLLDILTFFFLIFVSYEEVK